MGKIVEFIKKAKVYIIWVTALIAALLAFMSTNPFPEPDGDVDTTEVVVPK